MFKKVESLREQLRSKTSERRQAYAGCGAVESASGKVTRLNSTDSAFSLSTEDRIGVRVAEMETEIRSLKVYHFYICSTLTFHFYAVEFLLTALNAIDPIES